MNCRLISFMLFLFIVSGFSQDAQIYTEPLTLPTYGIEAPDRNPRFYEGRVYQGAQGRIYPYPLSDVLTNEMTEKTYEAVYLENDFIRVSVLPELGGRIFTALDKTNDYDFFYRQQVIKPSLIGMLGAWISGGVEWNFPHHHRANTFMPMDYTIEEHDDGSKTLWLTEIERRHRMKFLIGLRIAPNSSVLECKVKLFNRTPMVHSFLYFANPAVHVDSTYQVIFPPDVQFVTQHAKKEFAEWPVADSRYGGHDYDEVDISWWKNLEKPVSFFAWDHKADYFAGYDHGRNAGTAYVANTHLAPGKKFFTFGSGSQGKMWDDMLTDADGPYLELMAGVFSDNQPDYSWIQPYEVKEFTQLWFPIRNLGGMDFANEHGALALQQEGDSLRLAVNTTSPHADLQIAVAARDEWLLKTSAKVSPAQPFEAVVSYSGERENLRVVVRGDDGVLMSYKPPVLKEEAMPEPVTPPGQPTDIPTNEELYLTGLRLDQFQNARLDPMTFYQQALQRDSLDARVNTQVGILSLKGGEFEKAERHLRRAVQRLQNNYTRVRDGEALYYLGVTLKMQNKLDAAYDALYRAAWSYAWRTAAYYELAEIDCRRGDYETALQHIERSLWTNSRNTKAYNLKAAILRQLGRIRSAQQTVKAAEAIDPLDFWTQTEAMISGAPLPEVVYKADEQMHLEIAVDYARAGLVNEAVEVLSQINYMKFPEKQTEPLALYWLGYLWGQLNDADMSQAYFKLAAKAPTDYVFPYRWESEAALKTAIAENPRDAKALLYLGNLHYDHQPETAMGYWRQAATVSDSLWLVFRNLGYGYGRIDSVEAAINAYEKALALEADPRVIFELDRMYERAGKPPAERLQFMQNHLQTVRQRDDALQRYCELLVLNEKYDAAINILDTHHFNKWEGGGAVHDLFVDAHLLRGIQRFQEKEFEAALADFRDALDYPRNLEVGKPISDPRAARTWSYIGLTLEQLGRDADNAWKQAATADVGNSDFRYFKALALQKQGTSMQAESLLRELLQNAQTRMQRGEDVDFFAKFGERQSRKAQIAAAHHSAALAYWGLGQDDAAETSMQRAARLDPHHPWYILDLYPRK